MTTPPVSSLRLAAMAALAWIAAIFAHATTLAAQETKTPTPPTRPTIGSVERLDPRLDKLIDPQTKIEVLARGFKWAEGPVWSRAENALLFTDIPNNAVMKWKAPDTVATVFIKPAGYTGQAPPAQYEPGANGLAFDSQGRLILCQHGDRRIARLTADARGFETLADRFEGRRFNSPNDLAFRRNGDLYFTDPPYGLAKNVDDPAKELPYQGVFRLAADSTLTLLTREMTRPNGLAFSPDEKTLYVANSDPQRAIWMAFPVKDDGTLGEGRVFFDATDKVGKLKGLPDGLKVDVEGHIFATGPGGVLIFAPDGTHLGSLLTGVPTANCAFGGEGSTLYITASDMLLRVETKTRGINIWQRPQ